MRKQFWLGMAVTVALMSSAAMAQTQGPQIFGKKPVTQQPAGRFNLQPQQQDTKPGPIIFGRQTRVSANTPQTGTTTPVYRRNPDRDRDRDRRHDSDWIRRNQNSHPGWNKGKKKGWDGCDVPPGQAKKVGCTPGRDWRDRDRDRDRKRKDHDQDDHRGRKK